MILWGLGVYLRIITGIWLLKGLLPGVTVSRTTSTKLIVILGRLFRVGMGRISLRIGTVAEPIDHTLLESDWSVHQPSSKFIGFTNLAMQAQQGRYTSTGLLTAWSEGSYPPNSNCPSYIYELLVDVDNQGNYLGTWHLKAGTTVYSASTCPPLAYTKVAFAYLALYGENAYTLALVNAAKKLATASYGFGEGTY